MSKIQIIGYDLPDFFAEFKKSIMPDLREQLSKDFQPKQPTEYLTRKQVCTLLNINLSTLYRWCKDGTIPSYGISNRVYMKRSEVEEIINKNKLS